VSYIAQRWSRFTGEVAGNGHCVALVRETSGAPATASWRPGAFVAVAELKHGTCVATFDPDGTYGNHTDGRSHAVVFLRHTEAGGFEAFDQWKGHPAGTRIIRDKAGAGPACDDASRYQVIE
jgi:hypothetical protein